MDIELTFQDLMKLAASGKLETGGTTITIGRPVLPEVTIDPHGKSGKVVFSLDEADPRTKQILEQFQKG
jgi:hypothetical protein